MPTEPASLRRSFLPLTISVVILFATTTAWCHGISVFAWVAGEQVLVESKFSGGKRPVNATVRVFDPEGKELLHGTTDAQGSWAFDLPQRTALKIVLEAGMGHRGEWTLSAEEVGTESSTASADVKPHTHTSTIGADATKMDSAQVGAPAVATPPVLMTAEDIDARLRKVVADELASVTARLTRLEERLDGPSLQDILGGLGYILGLVGIGAYIQSRRSRDSQPPARKAP